LTSLFANKIFASPDAIVYVYPNIVGTTVNNSFYIEVRIADVIGLYGYEFKLYFNKTLLQATSLTKGSFFPDSNIMEFKKEINNTGGYVWYAISLLSPETPKSGSGSLAKVSFNAINEGNDTLTLQDVLLGDINASPISFTTSNATVSVTKETTQPPGPTPIPGVSSIKFDIISITSNMHVFFELPSTLKSTIKMTFIVQPTPLSTMTIGDDAIINWWVTLNGTGNVILNQTMTVYVITDEPKTVTLEFSLPEGEYTFYAKVIRFGNYKVDENLSSQSFTVSNLFYDWLFIEKNIYLIFAVIVAVITVIIVYKRRSDYV
jgi:hypothetical protein